MRVGYQRVGFLGRLLLFSNTEFDAVLREAMDNGCVHVSNCDHTGVILTNMNLHVCRNMEEQRANNRLIASRTIILKSALSLPNIVTNICV